MQKLIARLLVTWLTVICLQGCGSIISKGNGDWGHPYSGVWCDINICKTIITFPTDPEVKKNLNCWWCAAYFCTAMAIDASLNIFVDTALLPADLFMKPKHDKYSCDNKSNQIVVPIKTDNSSVSTNTTHADGAFDSVGILEKLKDAIRTWPDKKLMDVTTVTEVISKLQNAIDAIKSGNNESAIRNLRSIRHEIQLRADKSGANHLMVESAEFDLTYVAHSLGSTAKEDNLEE